MYNLLSTSSGLYQFSMQIIPKLNVYFYRTIKISWIPIYWQMRTDFFAITHYRSHYTWNFVQWYLLK